MAVFNPPAMKLLLRALFALTAVSTAQAAFPTLYLKPVVLQQLHSPTCIVAAPGQPGRLYVCDQPGRIHIIENGMLRPVPFLDISNSAANAQHRKVMQTGGVNGTNYDERGLLSLAFHPGYSNPASPGYRRFYVNYNKSYQAGIDPPQHDGGSWTVNCTTVVAEFQASTTDLNAADPLSERKLLRYPQPQSNHNGGNVVFDANGLLYIGSGDGGSADDNNVGHTGGANTTPRPTGGLGNGQDRTVYLGKILRIDPLGTNGPGGQYGIPAANPLVGTGGGVKEEIYAYGIRNPWGLSFDEGSGGTGRLFCADVGQGRIEEVNLIVNGGNYGWRYLEGTERPSFSSTMSHPGGTLIDPIMQYGHPGITGTTLPLLGLSITGGHVYRGSAIPALQGKYVFGDYGATNGAPSGRLMGLEETSPGSGTFVLTAALPILGGNPLSTRVMCLGRDAGGELFVGTKSSGGVQALENGRPNGGIYQLVAAPVDPAPLVLTSVKDNTLFSENGPMGEELSNGGGDLFIGAASSGDLRRALLRFDLGSIPAGARFGAAFLQVHVNNADTPSGTPVRSTIVQRLLESWGETTSTTSGGPAPALTGDATWLNRLYSATTPTAWTLEGGDFSAVLSSSFGIGSQTGHYAFFGPQMTADVHDWLAAPALNHGWIILSDESTASSTKRIDSRESTTTAFRPILTLVHATPYEKWLAQHFPTLLTGQYLDPSGDTDGDALGHQLEYAFGLDPALQDASSSGFSATITPPAASRDLTLTFRRDSSATDLTYTLQISPDLTAWTPIAQSTGGAAPSGLNSAVILSDTALTGSLRLVTVSRALTAGDAERHFVRLVVDRAP